MCLLHALSVPNAAFRVLSRRCAGKVMAAKGDQLGALGAFSCPRVTVLGPEGSPRASPECTPCQAVAERRSVSTGAHLAPGAQEWRRLASRVNRRPLLAWSGRRDSNPRRSAWGPALKVP